MKTLRWALAALFLTATALAQSIEITAPAKAASGTSYSISVSYDSHGDSQGDYAVLVVFEDGNYRESFYCDTYSNNYLSWGGSFLHTGNKNVLFSFDIQDYFSYGPSSASGSTWVRIYGPPVGSFDSVTSVAMGQNLTATGWAVGYFMGAPVSYVDYYLDNVYAGRATLGGHRPDVQTSNVNGAGYSYLDVTYSGWNISHNTGGLALGNHSLRVVTYDNEGLSTDLGTKTFSVVNTAPDSATVSTAGITQLALGGSLSLTGTLHDSDGNLAYHNLYWRSPGSADWNGLLSGAPSNNTNSSLSASFTPTQVGQWSFHSNGHDNHAWGPGATASVNVYDGAPPSVPAGLGISGVSGHGFTLTWSPSSDNVGVGGYEVSRNGASQGTTSGTSMAFGGLTDGVSYSLAVRAHDAAGNWSGWSGSVSVTTPDVTAPAAPPGLSCNNLNATGFVFTWSGSGDNVGTTGYEVYLNGGYLGYTSSNSWDVSGLSPTTNYTMAVRARDAAGNWSSNSSLSITTASDTTAPGTPSYLNANEVAINAVNLTWSAASDNVGVTGYNVYLNGGYAGTTGATSFRITGLASATAYSFAVRARDAAGNESSPANLTVTTASDTTAPSAPFGLAVSDVTTRTFTLGWNAASDNVGVVEYHVFCNGGLVATTSGTSCTISGQTAGTTVTMTVRARDAAWNTASADLEVLLSSPPSVAISAPSGGSTLTLTQPVTLTATAVPNSSAAIARVEYFSDGNKIGESASAPYALSWAPKSVGPTTLTARATDALGASATSVPVSVQWVTPFPYYADFEAGEGYPAGNLNSLYGWSVAAGGADIVSYGAASGSQAVVLNSGSASQIALNFTDNSATIAYLDCYARPVAGASGDASTQFDVQSARVAFVQEGGVGRWMAMNGNGNGAGTWVPLPATTGLGGGNLAAQWVRLTVRLNHAAKTYDVYLDGRMVVSDLAFVNYSASRLASFTLRGLTGAGAWLDDLYAGGTNPLFADANNDGIDDAVADDRYGDSDGDGLSNLSEYLRGTNPKNADSDQDGLPDGWEVSRGLNPLNAADANQSLYGLPASQAYRTGRTEGPESSLGTAVKVRTPGGQRYQVAPGNWAISSY